MKVTVARSAGFCFGVKRAVDTVYEQSGLHSPVYTYGPIIHNEEVVADLAARGVRTVESLEELESCKKGIVIIRSHGVSESIYQRLGQLGFEVVDATCPFVLKIHRIVKEKSADGRRIIIIGNRNHPEVEGICGWCSEDAIVINSSKEAEELDLPAGTKVCVVAQTTFN